MNLIDFHCLVVAVFLFFWLAHAARFANSFDQSPSTNSMLDLPMRLVQLNQFGGNGLCAQHAFDSHVWVVSVLLCRPVGGARRLMMAAYC